MTDYPPAAAPRRPSFPRLLLSAVMPLSAAACASSPSAAEPAAELLLTHARVYTVEAEAPWAESVAIRDGRIVAVGSDAQLAPLRGDATRVVDLGGRLVLPAFGDAHAHPVFGGMSHSRCSLHRGESVEDYRKIISGCVAGTPGSTAIYGVGWRDGLFPPDGVPHKDVLDAIAPDRPLIFLSVGGHSLWLNSKALEVAGITRDTPDPPNGHIDRDPATGEPIGGLQEAAMELVQAFIPSPTGKEMQDSIAYAARHFNSLGITSWHDAGIDVHPDGTSPTLDAYQAVRERGELTSHVSIALKWQNERALEQLPDLFRAAERARALGLAANGVKFYVDGVIPQRTAAMLEPYEESGDIRGTPQIPEALLKDAVREVDARGMQAHIHAIGDGAVREGLDAIAEARRHNGPRDHRHMISHLNVIDPADQPRFGELGAVAVFQPLWATHNPYMQLTAQRIGARRMGYSYPTHSVLKAGGRIAYGADWPVASANPLEGIQVALTRTVPGERNAEPLLIEERVTLAEAIEAYTLNVAYVNQLDTETGSIVVGKSADLIVLDRDIFRIPATEISSAKVLLTLFEGRAVFGDIDALK